MQNEVGFKNQYILIYGSMNILKNIFLCTALFVNNSYNIKKQNNLVPANLSLDNFLS